MAKTFSLACRLLPRDVRDDVYLLYLVFRTLDDLVDEQRAEAAERVGAVAAWAAGTAGARTDEVLILEDLAARHPLPREAFAHFCAGMRQDLDGDTFETEDDVDRYCYRVAGTVGLVMAAVLGTARVDRAGPAAAALGMAMQRTNVLRDIDEDAAVGRVYIAREAIERCGSLEPGAREALLRDQIPRADALYERGLAGIGELRRGNRAIAAAAAMYRELLRQLSGRVRARAGPAVVPRRANCASRPAPPGARRSPPSHRRARSRPSRREVVALAALGAAQVAYGLGSRPPAATRGLVGAMLATSAAEARRAGDGRAMAAAGGSDSPPSWSASPPAGRSGTTPTRAARPARRGVPLLAAAAWAMMARPAWVVAGRSTPAPRARGSRGGRRAHRLGRLPGPADGAGRLLDVAGGRALRGRAARTSWAGSSPGSCLRSSMRRSPTTSEARQRWRSMCGPGWARRSPTPRSGAGRAWRSRAPRWARSRCRRCARR